MWTTTPRDLQFRRREFAIAVVAFEIGDDAGFVYAAEKGEMAAERRKIQRTRR